MTLLNSSPRAGWGTLELEIVSPGHWRLQDNSFPPSDSRHLLASLHETPERDINVIWLQANLPSRTRYRTPGEVLHDIASLRYHSSSRRKPVEIRHQPPLSS